MSEHRLLTGFATVVTNDGERPGDLAGVDRGAVAVRDGRVAWVGPSHRVPEDHADAERVAFPGATLVPGFVDAHTHLAFAGHRASEFALRAAGTRYEELLAAGGGIHATVSVTREASEADLAGQTRRRLRRMLETGTTTVEVKSGYGLSVEDEVRLLEVVDRLGADLPIDVVPTFLGAHAVPPGTDRAEYLDLVLGRMLPACAPLAEGCDVFCDEGAFTVEEARRVLTAGREAGLVPRVHAEQLARTGAAVLAAEVGAASADHLDQVGEDGIEALARSGVVAVLVPGASFSLGSPPAPARRLWEAGVTVAVATDCNPGTSYLETMHLVVALAVSHLGLTPDEAVWAATRGGALALRRPDRGIVRPGARADLVVLDADSPVHLAYRPDGDLVAAVLKDGVRVV